MSEIYLRFPGLYREYLSQPFTVDELLTDIPGDNDIKLEALYYLAQTHGICSGFMAGFPYCEGSALSISESVLTKQSIEAVIVEYYQWHFVNPKKQKELLERFGLDALERDFNFFTEELNNGKPAWYDHLNNAQKSLILEIESALNGGLRALPTIGLRTLLETIMVEKVGDAGGFAAKVKRFTSEGFITSKMAEALNHVLDAGNASAHRAYFPNQQDLMTCVDLVKHLMHGVYILKPSVDRLAEKTPKRT